MRYRVGIALILLPWASLAFADPAQQIYQYRNDAGRTVYVNNPKRFSAKQQWKLKVVDLSHVSSNIELGTDLTDAARAEVKRLGEKLPQILASRHCVSARNAAARSPWQIAWEEHSILIVLAGVGLLLLISVPWMAKRYHLPSWGRTVAFVLPLLLTIGFGAWGIQRVQQSVGTLDRRAEPCRPEAYAQGTAKESPGKLLGRLRGQLKAAYGTRAQDLDAILAEGK